MDLVKFAKFVPERALSDASFEASRRLVWELSARERDTGEASSAAAATSASHPLGEVDPHAPSPESTTESFGHRADEDANDSDDDDGPTGNVVTVDFGPRRPTEPK